MAPLTLADLLGGNPLKLAGTPSQEFAGVCRSLQEFARGEPTNVSGPSRGLTREGWRVPFTEVRRSLQESAGVRLAQEHCS